MNNLLLLLLILQAATAAGRPRRYALRALARFAGVELLLLLCARRSRHGATRGCGEEAAPCRARALPAAQAHAARARGGGWA